MTKFKSAQSKTCFKSAEKGLLVNSKACKVNLENIRGTLITYSVVIDSYQVPRTTEAWPLTAITIVYLMFAVLQFSCTNKQ